MDFSMADTAKGDEIFLQKAAWDRSLEFLKKALRK
jgi:hypothetical protein